MPYYTQSGKENKEKDLFKNKDLQRIDNQVLR